MRRTVSGTVAALAGMTVMTAVMLPLRGSMSIATTALILVVPVVIGVVTGGFAAGAVSVVAGFLVYDFFFIPPYLTLNVGAPENWVALGVYVVVMLPVARVVAGMNLARARELRQGRELRELFELSDLLVGDKPLDVLLSVVVTSLAGVSGARQVALFLPAAGPAASTRLEIAARAGDPLSDEQLREVLPSPGTPASLKPRFAEHRSLAVLALSAAGRPVGLLALSADAAARHEREPLLLFANHIALAVERAQLREEALRTRVNAEMARLAKTLVAAVAHDLRAPLASLKASSSTLADPGLVVGAATRQELAVTIDAQADRLGRMVSSLLDMSRIQAGVLRPRRAVFAPDALVSDVMRDPPPSWQGHEIRREIDDGLPPADADPVLITRVLANLVDNAVRHSPAGAPVTIRVAARGETIGVSVTDSGPGVPPARREEIFGLFPRREHDAGAGLGLTIARTFVEAHGQRVWVEDAPGGGARFCFTLPVAPAVPDERAVPGAKATSKETRLAARAHH